MAISDMSASPSHTAMIRYDLRRAPTRRWEGRAATEIVQSTGRPVHRHGRGEHVTVGKNCPPRGLVHCGSGLTICSTARV